MWYFGGGRYDAAADGSSCTDLLDQDYETEECLYWIALTYYALGELRASRSHCERLLRMDPAHKKALALHNCIKDAMATGMLHGVDRLGCTNETDD